MRIDELKDKIIEYLNRAGGRDIVNIGEETRGYPYAQGKALHAMDVQKAIDELVKEKKLKAERAIIIVYTASPKTE